MAETAGIPEAPSSSGESRLEGVRMVDSVAALRALAHPVRVRLVELLSVDGAQTATEAGAAIGETPTTCSFHFRQLQRYGFVEEAGGGAGRARPWKLSSLGLSFADEHADEETRRAAELAIGVFRDRQLERYRLWRRSQRGFPLEWRNAATDSEFLLWVTPGELATLNEAMIRLIEPFWRERNSVDARPTGSLPVELLFIDYPIRHPDDGTPEVHE